MGDTPSLFCLPINSKKRMVCSLLLPFRPMVFLSAVRPAMFLGTFCIYGVGHFEALSFGYLSVTFPWWIHPAIFTEGIDCALLLCGPSSVGNFLWVLVSDVLWYLYNRRSHLWSLFQLWKHYASGAGKSLLLVWVGFHSPSIVLGSHCPHDRRALVLPWGFVVPVIWWCTACD